MTIQPGDTVAVVIWKYGDGSACGVIPKLFTTKGAEQFVHLVSFAEPGRVLEIVKLTVEREED